MKFQYIFSIASLLLASAGAHPVDSSDAAGKAISGPVNNAFDAPRLRRRDDEDNFEAAVAAGMPADADTKELHAFKFLYPPKDHPGHEDLNKLTTDMGGSHCALVVGSRKGGDEFEGQMFDLLFTEELTLPNGNDQAVVSNRADFEWRKGGRATLEWLGKVSSRMNFDRIQTRGKNIVGQRKYNVNTFNCQTYVTELWGEIKTI